MLRFSVEYESDFLVDVYHDGESLLKAYKDEKKKYDILFLDIGMDKMNGIDVAKEIRSIPDRNVEIVFITCYPGYMADSFDVQAFQYLLKPLEYMQFCQKLKPLLCYLSELETNIIVSTMNGEEVILYLEDILCLETQKDLNVKSILKVTTINGEVQIKGKIADYKEQLENKYFIQVHRSALVNMRYIRKFSANSLEFTTGKKIAVSRRKLSEIKEVFSKYKVLRYNR